jgi:hypothetical protein
MLEGLKKEKKLKKQLVPRVPKRSTRGRAFFPECLVEALGEEFFSYGSSIHTAKCTFFFECLSSLSVALGEGIFPECHAPIGTRGSLPSPSATLGGDCLPRVLDFWHSGKYVRLGEFRFSRTDVRICISMDQDPYIGSLKRVSTYCTPLLQGFITRLAL